MRDQPEILIADDDPAIRKVLTRILELNDYVVIACSDGSEAIEAFGEHMPAAVILDVRMPAVDGIMVCAHIRGESDVPIIMLTALDDESDAAAALEAGADDYIRKPFGARELIARLKAVMRRSRPEAVATDVVHIGGVTVDFQQRMALCQEEELRLSKTEFALLAYMVRNPNRVLTHDQILEKVWGADYVGSHHVLRVTLSRLRQRLAAADGVSIESLSGIGYRLRAVRGRQLAS